MRIQKKICLITPNHIATDPRLVKEAIALEEHGFAVHLVFTLSDVSGSNMDNLILQAHPGWTYDVLVWGGGSVRARVLRFRSGLVRRSALLSFRFLHSKRFVHYILNRHFSWQVQKAVAAKADLYIAHNLGALPVAQQAAVKCGAKYGFDAEDFHRHEVSDDINNEDVRINAAVEENYLGSVDHFTAASPLIGKAYQEIFPNLHPLTVLNVFPRQRLLPSRPSTQSIRLFWFSQTIGPNRGVEIILEAMHLSKASCFELHLLGNPSKGYRDELRAKAAQLDLADRLFYYNPVPEAAIFTLAASCDIGMASETGVPYNRNICLTNKIFTYIQSGLAVIASDTKAQKDFFSSHAGIGKLYQNKDAVSLATALDYYAMNRDELYSCKQINFELGQTELNWEAEQNKFLNSLDRGYNERVSFFQAKTFS